MGKYTPLENYLRRQSLSTTQVILTFAKIEEIIAPNKLPDGARVYFTFWANWGQGRSEAWIDAGWKTVMVDLENEKVRFKRREEV
jgi:hypothetical protein